ncbi:hypothetical protein [Rhizobium sp. ICMP 5592]|uniref:hypothetical protein n=1 Tax=Rhizobium sp. ICMP 5592 TaxID=2292445 RepID=UPI001295EC2E|nr:hypothetical protein [Rhizobium sp. ICMP 5592]MQB44963.1 hypothetical protein [Rhizobium sp. ICMP 5592]
MARFKSRRVGDLSFLTTPHCRPPKEWRCAMRQYPEEGMRNADSPKMEEAPWSVFDFARRYRLEKNEENRLLTLFGTEAPLRELLFNARRLS